MKCCRPTGLRRSSADDQTKVQEPVTQGLAARVSAGAAWMIALRVADQLIGILSLAVLARLLLPADFGLVNYAMIALGLLELLSNFGVEVALIRDGEASRKHFDTAWTIGVIKGVTLCATLLLLAHPVAIFFDAPALETVTYAVAFYPLISGFENIGTVYFRKDLQFHRQFALVLTARSLATVITIVLAWIFRSYWALVWGTLARSTLQVALSYAMHPYRPRASLSEFRSIFDFSKWLFVQNLINGLNERLPALIVGRLGGVEALAYFNVGQEISNLATTGLRAPIRQALFPGFAKLGANRPQLSRAFKESLGVLLLVSLPIPIGIGLTASYIVRLFLGTNWMAVVPLLQMLAVFGVVSTLGTSSHLVYWTVNRPGITALLSGLRFVLLVPLAVWLVLKEGAIGAAVALAISMLVVVAVDYVIVLRVLELRLRDLVVRVWRVIVAAVVMAAAVAFTLSRLSWSEDPRVLVAHLVMCVIVGCGVYVATLTLLWIACGRCDGPERQAFDLLRRRNSNPPANVA